MSAIHNPTKRTNLTANEKGMVSIMVTMILMIVIALIVVGFAQLSRRTTRESLDRQLSTQAFYAAESGINEARKLIETAVAAGQPVPAKTTCDAGSGASSTFYGGLDTTLTDNVSYSCLLVNPAPKTLVYNDIGTKGTVIPLISATGSNFTSLKLNWQSKTNSSTPLTGCPTSINGSFSQVNNWSCGYGVLRFDLVSVAGGSLDANTLANATMTSFAVPLSANGTNGPVGFSAGGNGSIGVACSNTGCELTINGLNSNQYYMRVSSIYQNVSLQVSLFDGNGAAATTEAQVVIDATGKAQDVLRRIQVRVPYNSQTSSNLLPDNALESTDSVCKRFSAMAGKWLGNTPGGVTGTNALCQP